MTVKFQGNEIKRGKKGKRRVTKQKKGGKGFI